MPSINDLPEEILEYIIGFLSYYRDLSSTSAVNKCWYCITKGVARKKNEHFLTASKSGALEWHVYQKDTGPTISERYSHCAVYYNKSVYVFGGCTATNTTFNDLWRFDLSSNQWIRPLAMGSYPSPKACASLVTYNNSLILFGGWSHPTPYPLHQASRYFNQLHIYCPLTNRWSGVASTNTPPGKAGHSASVINDNMIVFGGSQRDLHSCNDLWVLDLTEMSWKKQVVSGKKPMPRYGHSMTVLDDEHLLLVGGCGGQNMVSKPPSYAYPQFTDVWILDMSGDDWVWQEVKVEGTEWLPPQLWFHPLCKVRDRLVTLSKSLHPPAAPEPRPTSQKHSLLTTQLAQIRRNLPDTSASESSSQESSSDTDDVTHAGASNVRPRAPPPRHATYSGRLSEPTKPCIKSHSCTKCGNHWDVCVCTGAASFNALPRNSGLEAGPSCSSAAGADAVVPQGQAISQFRTPFRPQRAMSMVKANASKNRQKQLDTLRRYEEKFKNQLKQEGGEVKLQGHVVEFVNHSRKRPQHPMYVHTLDISRVLSEGIVNWQPVKASSCQNAPEETILYSIVEGRAELIMFGGIQMDINSMQRGQPTPAQAVSNEVYFLRPANVLI